MNIIRYALALLWICLSCSVFAQDNPLFLPVRLIDGSLSGPLEDAGQSNVIRKAGVRSITVFRVGRHDAVTDTSKVYREIYSDKGDRIPYHHEFGDYDGFNSIIYNRNGTIAEKQWKTNQTLGCGTGGITWLLLENHTRYVYQKKRLVLELNGTKTNGGRWHDSIPLVGLHQAYRYNKKGLKISESRYYLPDSTEKDTSKDIRYFRYNNKGKIMLCFTYTSRYSRPQSTMDSLMEQASPELGTILLRQSSQWHDTVMRYDFPEPDNETDEASETRQAAIDFRDSADAARTDFYEDDKNAFEDCIAYDYTPEGLLKSKLHFKGTDLSRKDTFTYNDKGQFVKWETWHLDYDNDFQPWELPEYNPLALHAIWSFTYDGRGRVATCTLQHYTSPLLRYSDRNYHFQIEKEITYTLLYDPAGKVSQVNAQETAWHYNMNPDVMPPVTHETTIYPIRYETW